MLFTMSHYLAAPQIKSCFSKINYYVFTNCKTLSVCLQVREVSNRIVKAAFIESDTSFTHLVTFFGQFTDHDLTFTPTSPLITTYGSPTTCDQTCNQIEPCFPIKVSVNKPLNTQGKNTSKAENRHALNAKCVLWSTQIPAVDPRFGINSQQCISFVRSAATCGSANTYGTVTPREQLNALTAYIDAGQVYGSDNVTVSSLRDYASKRGLLLVNTQYNDHGREFLPFVNSSTNACATRALMTGNPNEVQCFAAGEELFASARFLQSGDTWLTMLTYFVFRWRSRQREHRSDLGADDHDARTQPPGARAGRAQPRLGRREALPGGAQNPRSALAGEREGGLDSCVIDWICVPHLTHFVCVCQVITFRDYLPHIVGPDYIARQLSNYPGYDQNVDPSIANTFATAAYRFGHTIIQPYVFRLNESYEEHPKYPTPFLHFTFFASWRVIFEGHYRYIY